MYIVIAFGVAYGLFETLGEANSWATEYCAGKSWRVMNFIEKSHA